MVRRPISKNDPQMQVSNYSPTALVYAISKFLEKIINSEFSDISNTTIYSIIVNKVIAGNDRLQIYVTHI